jgi:hypothetical protein
VRAENAALAPARNREAANRSGLNAVWNAATYVRPARALSGYLFSGSGKDALGPQESSVLVRFVGDDDLLHGGFGSRPDVVRH